MQHFGRPRTEADIEYTAIGSARRYSNQFGFKSAARAASAAALTSSKSRICAGELRLPSW